MQPVKMIALFVENRLGQTARITKLLADAAVNIRWTTIANSGAFGVMKLLVADPEKAREALRAQGFMVSFIDVLPVEVGDQPGSLHAVAACLAESGINLDNTGGFVVAQGRAVIIVETHEIDKAYAALTARGLRVLSHAELLNV
jgi:adhesin HecA-like repeat protein